MDSLVITGGSAGMVVVDADGATEAIPAIYSHVTDVAGAGDTSIAVLALALSCGSSLGSAARVANAAAGAAVRRSGVSVVTIDDILSLQPPDPDLERAVGGPQTVAAVERWRDGGRRVVMANGCFDLLHAGHLHLLEAASAFGDVLIVAVNSDHSIRSQKGEGRPVVSETDRIRLIAGLRCVDAIVLFDEPTPRRLIELLRPDVLVKGADYEPDQVEGADIVRGWGGSVEIVPLLEGRSTTALLRGLRHDPA